MRLDITKIHVTDKNGVVHTWEGKGVLRLIATNVRGKQPDDAIKYVTVHLSLTEGADAGRH